MTYIPIGIQRSWEPSEYIPWFKRLPPVPCTIALNRRPYQLFEIVEVSPGNWKPDDWQEYELRYKWARDARKRYPAPGEWPQRPMDFRLTEPGKDEKLLARVQPWKARPTNSNLWFVLGDHYSVCASCGELSPCREYVASRNRDYVANKANEKLERDLQILPGCCWACGEVITQRQKSISLEGENVDLPGGPPVHFHLREKCRYDAREYEKRWAALDPRRRLTLSCPGKVIYHVDGMECSEDPLCPGEEAYHCSGMSNHRLWVDPVCLRCKDARARAAGDFRA